MPRLKAHRRARDTWPDGTILQLRTGYTHLGRGVDDADLQDAWHDLREQTMAEHLEHHRLAWPSRPWAWWKFERCEEPPTCLDPHWREAARLWDMFELDAGEVERFRQHVAAELATRRNCAGLDPAEWLPELETLASRLGQ